MEADIYSRISPRDKISTLRKTSTWAGKLSFTISAQS
jgi:hypothetical protein